MSLTVTEAFTDANGTQLTTHSANWNNGNALDTDFLIDTNAVTTPFNRNTTLFVYYSGAFGNNQWAQGTITQIGSSFQYMGVAVRCSAGNGYTFYHDPNGWAVFKTVASAATSIQSTGRTLVANDVMYLEHVGTTLTAKINGSVVYTGAQADLASGAPGVSGEGTAASGTKTLLDTWTGSDVFTTPSLPFRSFPTALFRM